MTTQKITSTLNAAGFKAFYTVSEKVVLENGSVVRKQVRKGDFYSFKIGQVVGVETYGVKTAEVMNALISKGLSAMETAPGSGMIKVA